MGERVRTAAIQMDAQLGAIEANCSQAYDLVLEAIWAGARFIALPEFFTTPIVLDDRLHRCSLVRDNAIVMALQALADEHDVMIGGSFLEYDGGDVYNTYVLLRPCEPLRRHRKDLPTMVECAFYIGGSDDGLVAYDDLTIGVAVCWETIRQATVDRLGGACDLIMSGSHWWSAPEWRFLAPYWRYHARLNADHMYRAPGRFARLAGAPLLHGAHCGNLTGKYPLSSHVSIGMRTHLVGEAQIVDAEGTIVARRTREEGPGCIVGEVVLGKSAAPRHNDNSYWLESLPPLVRLMWSTQNQIGRRLYRRARSAGLIQPKRDLELELGARDYSESGVS